MQDFHKLFVLGPNIKYLKKIECCFIRFNYITFTFLIMSLKETKTIFFDLDNTLFDHMRAEQTTLRILLAEDASFSNIAPENFLHIYDKYNTILWKKMGDGEITPDELKVLRFKLTFGELNLPPIDFDEFSRMYLNTYSKQTYMVQNTIEILDYLKPKFELGILSNGFTKVQEDKLSRLELHSYFKYNIYSEDVGAAKPHVEIFEEALKLSNRKPNQVVYIGDSYENDIVGAKRAGWHAIFFNPSESSIDEDIADFEIADLIELKNIF